MKNKTLKEEMNKLGCLVDEFNESPDEFTAVMSSLAVVISEIKKSAKSQGFSDGAINGALVLAFFIGTD